MTPRPAILRPDLAVCGRLARELGHRKQWVVWRLGWRHERWTKIPLMISGDPASSTDAGTWCHYDAAAAASSAFDGIGFVLTPHDPYTALDIDHCVEDGALSADAAALVQEIDSYAERSPSGAGVRILLRGQKPGSRARVGSLEVYDRERFVTVTGAKLPAAPAEIHDRQDALTALYRRLWPQEPLGEAPAVGFADGRPTPAEHGLLLCLLDLDPELRILWNGEWERGRWASQSEADASFVYKLIEAGCKPDAIQRLFRASSLYRDKTDARRGTDTYLTRTIARMSAYVQQARLGR